MTPRKSLKNLCPQLSRHILAYIYLFQQQKSGFKRAFLYGIGGDLLLYWHAMGEPSFDLRFARQFACNET